MSAEEKLMRIKQRLLSLEDEIGKIRQVLRGEDKHE